MRKLVIVLATAVVLAAVVAFSLTAVLAQEEQGAEAKEAQPDQHPLHSALADLVADGVITEAQARVVAERLEAVLHELEVHQHHMRFHEELEQEHGQFHQRLEFGAVRPVEQVQFSLLVHLFGMEPGELGERFQSGQSIASIGDELGIGVESIVATLVQPIQEHLEAAVTEGDISEEEAAHRLEEERSRIFRHIQGGG